jgi:hypothetical protein
MNKETMIFDGVEYAILIASDVVRDGLGFEVYRHGDTAQLVFEVFRDDGRRQFLVSQFEPNLPLSLIEYVVQVARAELGEFANQ